MNRAGALFGGVWIAASAVAAATLPLTDKSGSAQVDTYLPWVLVLHTRFGTGNWTSVVIPGPEDLAPRRYYEERECYDAADHYEAQARMSVHADDANTIRAIAMCVRAPGGPMPRGPRER